MVSFARVPSVTGVQLLSSGCVSSGDRWTPKPHPAVFAILVMTASTRRVIGIALIAISIGLAAVLQLSGVGLVTAVPGGPAKVISTTTNSDGSIIIARTSGQDLHVGRLVGVALCGLVGFGFLVTARRSERAASNKPSGGNSP